MSRVRVYFGVFGDWPDAAEVSAVIGREPSRFKAAGTPIGRRGSARRKRSAWQIESGLPESADFEAQLAALLDLLEPYRNGVLEARERYSAGIQCAAYWRTVSTGMHLSREVIARTAELGLSIDLDMYCLGEESDQSDVPKHLTALQQESARATELLAGKAVRCLARHTAREVMLELEDGARIHIDASAPLEISIT